MHQNSTTRRRRGQSSAAGNRSRSQHHRGPSGGNRNNRNNRGNSQRGRGQNIDPNRFIKAAKPVAEVKYTPTHSFNDFDVDQLIKDNLANIGYLHPSQIQDNAIPVALQGHDVIGIANTGTGKTAAFLVPLLQKLIKNPGEKALIVAPTRELAVQIQEEARAIGKGMRVYDVLLIGGTPMSRQLRDLRNRPEIIVGTPGRMKDHIERGTLRLDQVTTVVLDEVDRMLDMGFINDIRMILGQVPKQRQSLFFSATLSPTIKSLIGTFTNEPKTIMARTSETSDNVEQRIMHYYENTDKLDKLHELLIVEEVSKILIFCETKHFTERLSKELVKRGFTSDAIHGNKSQGQRQRALGKFKSGEVKILVATDVAARGIDVDGITHVINYDIPQTYDDYTHRIGRTGRKGTLGNAITFVTH